MDPRSTLGLVEPLGRLFFLGRSSRYRADRAMVLRRRDFESALKKAKDQAERGRLLRLLGRQAEAKAALGAAMKKGSPAGFAYAWELSCALGEPRPELLARALEAEPHNPAWLAWDAVRLAECRRRDEAVERARQAPGMALSHFAEGLAWLGDGKPVEAEAALTRGLDLEPDAEWAYRARALARHDQGRLEDSVADCLSAMRLSEMIGTLFIPLGLARGRASVRESIAAASAALARDPGAYWALVYRSDYRREPSINENAGALEDLERALAMKPDWALAWAYKARCQTAVGDFKGARESLDRAIALDPACGWTLAWRGEHQRRAGRAKEALADLEDALAIDPDYELAYAWRGGAKRALGKTKDALQDLDDAIALEPTYVEWCHFERMSARRELGRIGDALEDLESAHALNPKFAWENDPKKFAKALKELAKVPPRDPRRALALAWSGEILLRMRDFPAAESMLDKAVKADPGLSRARLLRGRARGENGRWAKASEDFEAAVRLAHGSGVALAWRGRAKLKRGDAAGAADDLAAALSTRTEQAAAWILSWKAEAELAAGRPKDAEASASRALELHSRYAEARLWRGLARAALGRRLEAREDLQAAASGELHEDARARLQQALAADDADPRLRAERLQREGQHEQAAALYGELLRASPGDPVLLERRAEAFRCQGQYAAMVKDLEALVRRKPGDAGALTRLGDARRHALDFEGGLADARAALALDARSAYSAVLEAECLRSLGRFSEALAAADRAVAADARWSWALIVRAKVRRFSGDLKGAEADCARAEALGQDPYAWGWRAEIRRKAGRLDEALADITKAVEARPTIAWFRALRGEILRALGRADEGWAELELAVRTDAHCSCAFDMLGAENASTKVDASLAWVYAWRGGVARKEERLGAARQDLERAAKLDPQAAWMLAWLGELDLREGRSEDALRRLDQALSLHPALRPARVWRGRAAFALGRVAAARKDFQAALDADANDPWALLGIAACHEKEGRAAQAKKLFARAKALAPALFA